MAGSVNVDCDFGFRGKVVLITGAGGNFGREGALFFAKKGAKLVITDVSEKELEETKNMVLSSFTGVEILSRSVDITNQEMVERLLVEAVQKFKTIDCCWNNAGIQGMMVPAMEYPVEDFQKVMHVNVNGSFIFMQAVAKVMKDNGTHGSILNTASVAALRGTPTMCAYVSSKAALIGLTMCAAKDFAPHNIRVNAISPALIGPGFMWDRQNELHAKAESPYFDNDKDVVAANKISSVPLKRLGTIQEVVNTAAFLLSNNLSSYTTGTNSIVAGGLA